MALVAARPDAPEVAAPALDAPEPLALGPEVPAEPALDVREGDEPVCAADGFGAPFGVLGEGDTAGNEALDDGFGAGVDGVGFGEGLELPPPVDIAGGLIPGWAPAPKLKPTAVPGCGSHPATPTWL